MTASRSRSSADASTAYVSLEQYESFLAQAREAVRLAPSDTQNNAFLVGAYLWLNRFEDAQAAAEEIRARNLDSSALRFFLYQLAFMKNDTAGMAQQLAWSAGKPGVEDVLLAFEAHTAAYTGSLRKARALFDQAIASAKRVGEKETAASYQAKGALIEALFGAPAQARQGASAALTLSNGRDVQYAAALAFSIAGDTAQARSTSDDLATRFQDDTLVQSEYVPAIRARLVLVRGDF